LLFANVTHIKITQKALDFDPFLIYHIYTRKNYIKREK